MSEAKPAEGAPEPGWGEPAYGALSTRAKLLALSGVLLGLLLAALDQTIVATATPRIVADLGGFDRFTWVFTAYLLASTTLVPIVGRLSDLYGRKWVLLTGLAIFMLGSVLSGTAQTMTQLIIYRGVQGLGAAGIMGNAFSVVADLFPPSERGRWQGLFSGMWGIASVIGPPVGGFITDNLTWRWIFYINLPVGILAVAMLLVGMPALTHHRETPRIDFSGVVLLIASVVPFLLALTWAGDLYAWGSPQIIGMFAASGALLGLFVAVERRAAMPIVPLWLFRNSVYRVVVGVVLLTGVGMFGAIIFIPLFIQGVLGASATSSGAVLIPMSLAIVATSALSGILISRTGRYRVYGSVGLAVMAAGLYLLSLMTESTSSFTAMLYMVVVGGGLGMTFPVYVIAAQNAFEHRVVGVVTASTQFFRSIGATIGVAVLGSFMAAGVLRAMNAGLAGRLAGTLPPEVVDALGDPQLLVDEAGRVAIEAGLAVQPEALAAFAEAQALLRGALTSTIQDIFLLSMGVVLLALAASLFLKEIPLRGRERGAPVPVAERVEQPEPGD